MNSTKQHQSEKSALAQQAICPECGRVCRRDMNDLIKEWKAAKPKPSKRIEVWIHYWECPGCGHKFRTATRIWPKN